MAGWRPSDADLRVNATCERFESAWRGGQGPRIEDYAGAVDPDRPALLTELLELELLRARGDRPQPQEYLARFPRDDAAVCAAFRSTPTGSGSGPHERAARELLFGIPPLTSSRFKILRPHARGGLGEVFVAHDQELNRDVALKQIRPGFAHDPACRARFLLEAEVTGGLEHPGIVPVYGLGTYADGQPYYAMRFVRGETLQSTITRFHGQSGEPGRVSAGSGSKRKTRGADATPLAFRRLLQRSLDVCDAVAYAHSRGVWTARSTPRWKPFA